MHLLENDPSFDAYSPAARDGQTEPITFYPDIYSDSLGAAEQWNSRESCTNDAQAHFRLVAENLIDFGNIVSYPV